MIYQSPMLSFRCASPRKRDAGGCPDGLVAIFSRILYPKAQRGNLPVFLYFRA